MAESVVSTAALHIVSMVDDQANGLSDVQPELDNLQAELTEMKWWLVEAEKKKELAYNEQVRALLAELRQIAYKAEDVVDNLALKSSSLFKWNHASKASRQLRELKEQMDKVKTKLDKHVNDSTESPKVSMSPRTWGWQPSEGHLHPEEDYVVGIDEDVNQLVQQLLAKSNDIQQAFDVVAIVGMGGSGKTTLARMIYGHRAVKRHFHCKIWVTLTQKWDAFEVLLDILKQAARGNKRSENIAEDEGHGFDVLGNGLREVLGGKRSLIVLDDVWGSETLSQILEMLIQLSGVQTGLNKIIITSRNRVLSAEDSPLKWAYYETQCLSESDGWELFDKVASKNGQGLDDEYHTLGKEMLRRCQGLPLAIVALAKLLWTKDSIQEWEMVFSQIEGAEGASLYRPINDILAVSFNELPYYLKPCFLYLGLFPERFSIAAAMLTRMWIAEGFVVKRDEEATLEDAAKRCLQGLIDRTMVQVERRNYAGKVLTIRLHDIMREVCLMKAREFDFLTLFPSDSANTSMSSRRAAINLSKHPSLPIENSQFRSLVLFGQSSASSGIDGHANNRYQATLNLVVVCENFLLVRVLDLSGIRTSDGTLPKEIGNLIHLRYLRMRSTNIRELPKSIGKLRNLTTLEYWDVYAASEVTIPNVLWKLKQLRHLYLPNEMSIYGDLKLHTITDLKTLWGVRGGDWMQKEMSKLGTSLQKLYVHGISSPEQRDAVFMSPIIKDKDDLYSLALDWYNIELKSLEYLQSKTMLQKLRLMGKLSENLCHIKFPDNLQKLELYYSHVKKPEIMEAIGKLPRLKFLRLSKHSYTGTEWNCSKEAFPKLEELKLCNLQLVNWKMVEGTMPSLRKLSIVSCLNLRKLPEGLQFISSLKELEIERMPYNFCNRLLQVKGLKAAQQGEDFHIIGHIPDIKIQDACIS